VCEGVEYPNQVPPIRDRQGKSLAIKRQTMKATVKILKISEKNKTIVFCSVSTKNGIFASELAAGFLVVDATAKVKKGDTFEIDINGVSTREQKDDGNTYTWLILS